MNSAPVLLSNENSYGLRNPYCQISGRARVLIWAKSNSLMPNPPQYSAPNGCRCSHSLSACLVNAPLAEPGAGSIERGQMLQMPT
jgi:hypothetical protein